ncbi:MAG: M4 family metallopeptidase, partial [Chloroflexi bacterium]|nr:M4 family metallopeptidase [Chloroflexota bacterium]
PYANADWDGSRMYFGQGCSAADDVVAHELTHGVTSNESDLIYFGQSGALNESFSDVWGEFVDQTNGSGTDGSAYDWLMGEDVPGFGAIRDMKNPPTFGDPDSTCSPNWYSGSFDNGGVHINSGVSNKLCYLLTEGATFNGHTVTGMGIPLVADLYYQCQVNLLTNSASYANFYSSLTQAAINLGLTTAQRNNIEQACQAVAITPATTCLVPPSNDNCANAQTIVAGTTYTGTNANSTTDGPSECGAAAADIWFNYTPTVNGVHTISTCGSNFDTVVAVYSGACAALTSIACNDDFCSYQSTITPTLNAGTLYKVKVAGFSGGTGDFSLLITAPGGGEGEGE